MIDSPEPDVAPWAAYGTRVTPSKGRETNRQQITVRPRPVKDDERAEYREELDAVARMRPRTRADCLDGPRPCPWVSCRWHLGLEVTPAGDLRLPVAVEPWEVPETCALDVADCVGTTRVHTHDGPTLEVLGRVLGVTRERVRQIEEKLLNKLRQAPIVRGLAG